MIWKVSYGGNFSISQGLLAGSCAAANIQASPEDGIVCAGDDFSLSASTNVGNPIFSWSGPNGFTADQPIISFNNATTAQSGDYELTVTDEDSCILTSIIKTITVIDFSTSLQSTPADGLVCEGSNFTIQSSTNATDPVYSWSGPGNFTSTQPSVTLNNSSVSQSGIYRVTVTDINGCTKSAETTINVVSFNVNLQSTPTDGTVCTNNNFTINTTTDAESPTYSWGGPSNFVSNQATISFNNVTTTRSGTYTVTVTNGVTGCTNSESRIITVHPLPSANIQANPFNGSLCEGETLMLEVSTNATEPAFAWSGPTNFSSDQPSLTFSDISAAQSGPYSVTVTDEFTGCSESTSRNITVHTLPSLNIVANPSEGMVCEGESFTLNAPTDAINPSFLWTGPSSFTSTQQNLIFNNTTPEQSGIYSLVVTDLNGCTKESALNFSILNTPEIQVTTDDHNVVVSVINGTYPFEYYILGGDFETETEFFSGSISNVPDGEYTIIVKDSNDCTVTVSTMITSIALIDPATEWGLSITPNPGRGLFDVILRNRPSHNIQLQVFNSAGHLIQTAIVKSTMTTLDLTNQAPGLYLLRLFDQEKMGSTKIIVMK